MVHIEYYQVQTTTSSSYFNSPSVLLILDGKRFFMIPQRLSMTIMMMPILILHAMMWILLWFCIRFSYKSSTHFTCIEATESGLSFVHSSEADNQICAWDIHKFCAMLSKFYLFASPFTHTAHENEDIIKITATTTTTATNRSQAPASTGDLCNVVPYT